MTRAASWIALSFAACTNGDGDADGLTKPPAGEETYGSVFAQATDAVTENGAAGFLVGAQTAPLATPASASACAGAIATVGACCAVPLPAAAATPANMVDIGTLTFADETTGSDLATDMYQPVTAGFDIVMAYGAVLLDPVEWQRGDALSVVGAPDGSASSGFPAFSAAVAGLVVPDVEVPTLARAQALAFSWTPDSDATTMTVALTAAGSDGEHGQVNCVVADSTGNVTVDASLTTSFESGDTVWAISTRETDRYVELGSGYITVASQGVHEVISTLP